MIAAEDGKAIERYVRDAYASWKNGAGRRDGSSATSYSRRELTRRLADVLGE